MKSEAKVLLVTPSNLGPYHQARYRYLSHGQIRLVVVKTPVEEFHRPWEAGEAHNEFHAIKPFERDDSLRLVFRKCRELVAQERPAVVVCVGYNSRYIWALSLVCKLHSIPCALYMVGWQNERLRSRGKEALKRLFVRNLFAAALATGALAGKYARELGVPAGSIYTIGNVVDNAHFATASNSAANGIENLPGRFFLTVSRLSPEKNISGLLQAFERYCEKGGGWDLCLAGTGPQQAELQAQAPDWLRGRVHWLGWLGYDQLPSVYQASGCFILPSKIEPWGLVVNEAMAAGKAVLVSTQCGCHSELCQEGRNGYRFSPENVDQLAALMGEVEALGARELRRMGSASQEIISRYTLETWRTAFIAAVQEIAHQRSA